MKKDVVYRGLNGLGFVFNAASICCPIGSPLRVGLKAASAACHVGAGVMAHKHNAKDYAFMSFGLAVFDAAASQVGFTIMTTPDEKEFFGEMVLFESCGSGLWFGKMAYKGLEGEAKEEEENERNKDFFYRLEKRKKREKSFLYKYPQSRVADAIFRGVNAVGLVANTVSFIFPITSPAHGACKAVSAGAHAVSGAMIMIREVALGVIEYNNDELTPPHKGSGVPLIFASVISAAFDGAESSIGFVPQKPDETPSDWTYALDGLSMTLQLGHLQKGLYPEITSWSNRKSRKRDEERRRRIDDLKP